MQLYSGLSLLLLSITRLASALDIATVDPCPQDPNHPEPITVTSQYQTVSTCVPQTENGETSYSYSTFAYVSTTISYQPDGTSTSSVVVTDTAQVITVTQYPEETSTAVKRANYPEVISKQGVARYCDIGDLAIPGWEGSGLCKECDLVRPDGSRHQKIHMQQCWRRGDVRKCLEYDQDWISYPVPDAIAIAHPFCSAYSVVNKAGTYTFTFPQPAITSYITRHGGSIVTATQPPWNAYITKACGGPTTFQFATTITKTITLLYPYQTGSSSAVITITNPPPTGFPHPTWGYPTGTGPSGPFVTVTIGQGGGIVGPVPVTATVAQPSGSKPGTVVVIYPTPSNSGGPVLTSTSSQPTGPYVTLTATGGPGATGTITATVAPPSGTAPGTIVIIDPFDPASMTSSSTSSSSLSDGATLTSTTTPLSFTTTTISSTVVISPITTSTSSPSLTDGVSFTTFTSDGTVIVSPILTSTSSTTTTLTTITVTTSTSTTADPGTTITILPSTTSTTTGGQIVDAELFTTCIGAVCVVISASAPIGNIGLTAILLPTTTGPNTVDATATGTSSAGPAQATIICQGTVCIEISASVPIGNFGVSATILPASTTTANPGSDGVTPTPAVSTTTSNGASCTGALCASVGVSLLDIGVTLTADVGGTSNGGTTPTASGAVATTTPCTGPLCASIGVSLSDVGVTLTAGLGGSGGAGTNTAAVTGATTTSCTGLLCASVGVSLSDTGVTLTAGLGNGNGATTTPAAAAPTTTTTNTINPAAATPCTGLLCASGGVSLSDAGATVTAVLGNGATTTPIVVVLVPTTTAAPAAAQSPACSGVLCASVGASLSDAAVTLTAGVLNGNGATTAGAATTMATRRVRSEPKGLPYGEPLREEAPVARIRGIGRQFW